MECGIARQRRIRRVKTRIDCRTRALSTTDCPFYNSIPPPPTASASIWTRGLPVDLQAEDTVIWIGLVAPEPIQVHGFILTWWQQDSNPFFHLLSTPLEPFACFKSACYFKYQNDRHPAENSLPPATDKDRDLGLSLPLAIKRSKLSRIFPLNDNLGLHCG